VRLKHLELQGFKTFATKTEFVFPTGVTAIVGPNGSGKSNVADALRWVLGEQTFSVLRAKKSEDLIFAGGEGRARAGVAEAYLTLDNSDGFFPIDFNEVVIGRRAYRDGENEYLLNGSKVRLREISELLAKTGLARRTYTVIGQGLVDQALSLNSEERRALFEEAAGIALYRNKREDALRKLDETRRNLDRVRDILAEIGPRVRQLERQAQRTRDYARLSTEVQGLQRIWFGYHWGQGQAALREARQLAETQTEVLTARRAEVGDYSQRIQLTRQRQFETRQQLNDWQRQAGLLRAQAEQTQRQLAVLEERARSLQQQIDQTQLDQTTLETEIAAQTDRVAQAQMELDAIAARRDTQAAAIAAAQQALNERAAQRDALQQARAAAQAGIQKAQATLADRHERRVQLADRRGALQRDIDAHHTDIAGQLDQQAVLEQHLADNAQTAGEIEARRAELQQQLDALHAELEAARQIAAQRDSKLAEARAAETRLRDRYAVLSDVRASLSGFDAGTRAVINAQLPGVRGILATLIDVDSQWERAVEAALGPDIQAIVVESRAAAQPVRNLLGDSGGRATLLPLDEIDRPRSVPSADQIDVPAGAPGCLPFGSFLRGREKPAAVPQPDRPELPAGLHFAAEYVTCDAALKPAVDALLSRVIVVETLEDAHALRVDLPDGYDLATRSGEVIRRNGVITLGRAAGAGELLAREREWRELPAQIEAAAQATAQAEAAQRAAVQTIDALTERQSRAAEQLRAIEADLNSAHEQRRGLERQLDDLKRAIDWQQGLIAQLAAEIGALDDRDQQLAGEEIRLQEQITQLDESLATFDQQLAQLPTEELAAQVNALQAEAAVAQQLLRSQSNVVQSYTAALEQIRAQLTARRDRAGAIASEQQRIGTQLTELRGAEAQLAQDLAALRAHIDPAEAALRDLEEAQNRLEAEERSARDRLSELETRHNQAVIDVARREEELNHLRARIDEELGLVQLEMAELSGPQPLPLTPIVQELPVVDELPDGLDQELQRLKAQLRRLGPINPEAQAEYEETHQRHEFLTQQASDLEEAIVQLHHVIEELDQLMEKSFRETFDAVAEEFKSTFQTLFGGGSARLVLTDPEHVGQTGIEVVARPPGKKQQGLALLSGGERSLTAAALMFAILKVKPPPFCILDETDAALDEANVGRFRDALKALSAHTQFVIITHNRGTIEAADTIYGISMGSDSASRAISLQLENVAQVD
jgi:chromosome segregation protein